jgi:pSer/pThr/pTyr-binding forkhead associated (FHA) protein
VEEATETRAYLVDDRAKVAHALSVQSTSIGRDASNEIVIRDPSASRFHAEIRQENESFVLHSIGATGTLLNAKPLSSPHTLTEGDSVEIAFVKLRFTRSIGDGYAPPPPHSRTNDEFSRKPTHGAQPAIVDENNSAGRHMRRVQLLTLLVAVLVGVWWWVAHRA